jgi:hypothetical protein
MNNPWLLVQCRPRGRRMDEAAQFGKIVLRIG